MNWTLSIHIQIVTVISHHAQITPKLNYPFRLTGVLNFVHHPGLKELEHDVSESGAVSVLR
jgi:hypothetical protein